jgi:hypothetical protein
VKLDFVTFGTPPRYGWDAAGYGQLLNVVNHRPVPGLPEYEAKFPFGPLKFLSASDGDYVDQIGIAGTNLMPLPLFVRTFLADRRLARLIEGELAPRWLWSRLKCGMRVPEAGTTVLVNYDDPARLPLHLFGHAAYTRSRWLPLHVELATSHLYS